MNISGGFRPHGSLSGQSAVHPSGRGLDYNKITMTDGSVHSLNRSGFKDGSSENKSVFEFNKNLINQPQITQVKGPWRSKNQGGNWIRNTSDSVHLDHGHLTLNRGLQ